MAKIVGTTCCGLKDLAGLAEFPTPVDALKYLSGEWLRSWRASFVMFGGDQCYKGTNELKRINAFADYIKKHKLGSITKSIVGYGSYRTYIWGVDAPRFRLWAAKHLHDFPFAGKTAKLRVAVSLWDSEGRTTHAFKRGDKFNIVRVKEGISYMDIERDGKEYINTHVRNFIISPSMPERKKLWGIL